MTEEILQNTKKYGGITGKGFVEGHPGGPGRPKLTEEQKLQRRLEKEMVKQYLKEYEEDLAEALPEINPVLIAKAKEGNMQAISEIHKVIGAHKNTGGNVVVPVQVNINDDREKYK